MSTTTDSVEWVPPDRGEWALEDAHGVELPSVTGRELMRETFAAGFRGATEGTGLPLSHAEMQFVNGWPYVGFFLHDVPRKAGKPPPDFVLKALTRLHPGFRRRTKIARQAVEQRVLHQRVQGWFAERETWVERILAAQQIDTSTLTDQPFAEHLDTLSALATDALRRHFELVTCGIPVGMWLNHCESWGIDSSDARRVVMYGVPVHVEAHHRLAESARALGDAQPVDLEGVRAHSTRAADALDEYLRHHGSWGTTDTVDGPVVSDFPAAILHSIRAVGSAKTTTDATAERLAGQLRSSVPEPDRALFDRSLDEARQAYRSLDDNSGILGSWMVGLFSIRLREAADRLAETGRILHRDHVAALTVEEIVELLSGSSPLKAEDVAAEHANWQRLADVDPPKHLNGEPSPPPDASVFPEPIATLMAGLGAFLDDKFNESSEVFGVGTEKVVGTAVVALDAAEALDRINPGDILVTTATTPGWNGLMSIAGGLVVSSGGRSSHSAVVARELELPTIVGYADALTAIPDGAMIELDPATASVRVLDTAVN